MKTKAQDLIPLIERTAVRAGEVYERQGQAFEDEFQAEMDLLKRAIELARPGLPSLVNMSTRTVELIRGAGKNAGGLFLTEDGRFLYREREDQEFTGQSLSDLIDGWGLTEILRALAHHFQKQIQGREPVALEVGKRVEKLQAIAKLLE